jgi:hypothetical protein
MDFGYFQYLYFIISAIHIMINIMRLIIPKLYFTIAMIIIIIIIIINTTASKSYNKEKKKKIIPHANLTKLNFRLLYIMIVYSILKYLFGYVRFRSHAFKRRCISAKQIT